MLLTVGSYSNASQSGIHLYGLNPSTCAFEVVNRIDGIENPSYLEVTSGGWIYAISEDKTGQKGLLSIYKIENNGKHIKTCSQTPYTGGASCFIAIDAQQSHAFIANYSSGSLTVLRLAAANGSASIIQEIQFSGRETDPDRQEQSHIHTAVLSKDGRKLFCTDLGTDRLYRFHYSPEQDQPLTADQIPYAALPSGSGPRHLDLSADGRWLYLITELSGQIFVYDLNHWGSGWFQQISVIQEGYIGKVEGGDIHLNRNCRQLYASNRGDANEIVVFDIDPITGLLSFAQRIGSAGLSPRNLLLCEEVGLLLAANEKSDNISVFYIRADGKLEFTRQHLHVTTPSCLKRIHMMGQNT